MCRNRQADIHQLKLRKVYRILCMFRLIFAKRLKNQTPVQWVDLRGNLTSKITFSRANGGTAAFTVMQRKKLRRLRWLKEAMDILKTLLNYSKEFWPDRFFFLFSFLSLFYPNTAQPICSLFLSNKVNSHYNSLEFKINGSLCNIPTSMLKETCVPCMRVCTVCGAVINSKSEDGM